MKTLLAATTNKGKIVELKAILNGIGYEIADLSTMDKEPPIVEEDGSTFAQNALKKARAYSLFYGLPTVADDSGLEVKALNGRPGVYSARYAATDDLRNARLLQELQSTLTKDRSARFLCVAAYVDAQRDLEKTCEGFVQGKIALTPVGDRGFGYDPVFYYPPLGKTFAQMSSEEKNTVSHRREAFGALRSWLESAGLED